jgi:hypothetical protein
MGPFKAENDHLTDTLILEWLLIMQIIVLSSGEAVLRFQVIKYLGRSEMLLCENSSNK